MTSAVRTLSLLPWQKTHTVRSYYLKQARTRPGPFGIGSSSSNNVSNKGFGSGFGNGSAAWNGDIWSSSKAIGSGIKNNAHDTGRGPSQSHSQDICREQLADHLQDDLKATSNNSEPITGSGSLLPSSESDGYSLRHGSWNSIEDDSPNLSRVHTNTSATSEIRRQNSSQRIPQTYTSTNAANASYFSATPNSTTLSSRPSQKNFLDPTSGNFASGSFEQTNMPRSSRHGSDEENRFAARKLAFEGNEAGRGMQPARPSFNSNMSGYNSSAASRSGSLPPSRSDIDATRHPGEMQNPSYSRLKAPVPPRSNMSAQAPAYTMPTRPSGQRYADQLSPSQMNRILGDFGNLNIDKENHTLFSNQSEVSYASSPHIGQNYPQELMNDSNELWNREDHNGYQNHQDQFSPPTSVSGSLISNPAARRGVGFGLPYASSPNVGDTPLNQASPYYSTAGTPPTYQQRAPSRGGFNGTLVTGQAAMLDRKLRGLQQEQQAYMVSRPTALPFNNQFSHPSAYEFHTQPGLRVNQLGPYYQMPVSHPMATSHIPRGPASDHAAVQPVRSALLEDFRNNSKTNKRYELKVNTRVLTVSPIC